MGTKYLTKAFEAEVSSSEKLLLVALANARNDVTGKCCPGQETLARQCGFNKRTVIRLLQNLKKAGYISVERYGRTDANNYLLHLDQPPRRSDIDDTCEVTSTTPRSDIDDTYEVTLTTPRSDIDDTLYSRTRKETEVEPEIEPEGEAAPACADESSDMVLKLAQRLADCRKNHSNLLKIDPRVTVYYQGLLRGILSDGEVGIADLETVVYWFEHSPEGQDTFGYGMSNMPKNNQHVLRRNMADYLSRARTPKKMRNGANHRNHHSEISQPVAPHQELITLPEFEPLDPARWKDALHGIAQQHPEAVEDWLTNFSPLGVANGILWLIAPSNFSADWVAARYAADLAKLITLQLRIVTAAQVGLEVSVMRDS